MMRRRLSMLAMLGLAVTGMVGCAGPAGLSSSALIKPVMTVEASAPETPALASSTVAAPSESMTVTDLSPAATIAQVAHLEAAKGPSAASHQSISAHGCPVDGACQTGNPCANGYAPYPTGYFNPYLLDPNEYICDGGDHAPHARAYAGDQLIGIGPEDTVVRYTTDRGDVHVQPSNRVCLYAPRFAAVRRVAGAEAGELAVGPVGIGRPEGPQREQLNQPGLAVTGRDEPRRGAAVRGPDAMRARDRGVPVENILQPELAADVLAVLENLALVKYGILRDNEKPWLSISAQSAIVWSIDEEVAVTVNDLAPVTLTRDLEAEELHVYDFPDAGRLRIAKLADKAAAQPGEIVTFMIRVDNVGDSAVHNVIITDNLVTRLEYVPDSQTCTAQAAFAAIDNAGQSLQLTWKLAEALQVGEGATIEFKCKVR